MNKVEYILNNLINNNGADKEDIMELLALKDDNQKLLFEAARNVRNSNFRDEIFLYGFVYFSTYCRNDCNFCYYRKSNTITRYRKTPEEVIQIAVDLANSGVNLIDLTMGEDQSYRKDDFKTIVEIIGEIKRKTGLPVMISPGVLSKDQIDKFAEVNTDWYALYQETHNKELFHKLRWDQSYEERMAVKLYAKEKGMFIEEGLLAGVGESYSDIADSILEMGRIGAEQLRVMSFVPQVGSPMENVETPDRNLELNIIAIFRLLYHQSLIPASLDVDGIAGLEARINAGANVVTSIIPPKSGFAGVAHNSMDVDSGGRTVEEASKILNNMGLKCAGKAEYIKFLREKK